jgi:saccharopine dehydrogenase (NADP+, L-glutamate forming)
MIISLFTSNSQLDLNDFMKKVVLFGAGKSATYAIDYLSAQLDLELTVIDMDTSRAAALFPDRKIIWTNMSIQEVNDRQDLIRNADIVLSLMPPSLHILIAQDCLLLKKHLITASYISPEIKALATQAEKENLMFMCELGLDPGIDHLSARQMIDEIEEQGGIIHSFKSHCGGLIAPESDDNPWRYKISWNPRNIVLAGKSGADFLENGKSTHVPYEQIFQTGNTLNVDDLDPLAYYPNRDSISYQNLYGLEDAHTLIRTTLRYQEFIQAWNSIIQYRLNDENIMITPGTTYAQWIEKCSGIHDVKTQIQNNKTLELLEYLNLFSEEIIPINQATLSADILLSLIEEKWKMKPTDKDMIVMMHEFEYMREGKKYYRSSTLVVKGKNNHFTAMAQTVGLPLAMLACCIIRGEIEPIIGVHIPVQKNLYLKLLPMLAEQGIVFKEKEVMI